MQRWLGQWPETLTMMSLLPLSKSWTRRWILSLLSLWIAACAPMPQKNPPPPAPRVTLTPWWQALGDPALDRLVAQALQANPSVDAARQAVQQARAAREVRVASLRPQLTLSAGVQRVTSDNSESRLNFNTGADASWELDVFGANQADIASSEADIVAAQANLRDVQLSLSAEVASAYIQLRGAQAQIRVTQDNLSNQTQSLALTRWRAQAGLASALDVAQAETLLAQTQASLPPLQASVDRNRHALAILIGQRPEHMPPALDAPAPVPQVSPDLAQDIPADTLRQRADLRAAEARVAAAMASVEAADAARYPRFKLGGSVGLTALTLSGLSSGATLATQLLGSVSVPVLDGGASQARVAVQQAALEQARANYQSKLLNALKEVSDALVGLRHDRERLTALDQAQSKALTSATLAQNRYASGLIDAQTVLQAQRTLLAAQDAVINAQTQLALTHIQLVKAVGDGWPRRERLPETAPPSLGATDLP
ncbi:MAG: efflux transporter outer membrane subunit [Rhodoferax sp.]